VGQNGRLEASTILILNKKSWVTLERLYPEERKEGRASGTMKEGGRW
jgi:hypothetical protein